MWPLAVLALGGLSLNQVSLAAAAAKFGWGLALKALIMESLLLFVVHRLRPSLPFFPFYGGFERSPSFFP